MSSIENLLYGKDQFSIAIKHSSNGKCLFCGISSDRELSSNNNSFFLCEKHFSGMVFRLKNF